MGVATFSSNGNYKIDVDAAVTGQSGLTSFIYWRVYVIKTYGSGYMSTTNMGNSGWADSSVGGNPDLWSNGNMAYNFQNGSNTGTFMIAEGNFSVQHRPDGNAEYFVNAGLNFVNLGSASAGTGWRSLPHIQTATVPGAPVPVGFGERTMTSIQYIFSGTTDGGSPIREWQALYQDATINGPQIAYASWGSTDLGGLLPGRMYNFWSRGRNDIGWGPWSAISSVSTVAPTWVKYEGNWRKAIPYVKHDGTWKLAQPYAKHNGLWKKTD